MCMKLKKIIKLTLITLVLGNVLSTSVFAVEISSSKPIESSSILFDTDNPNVGIEIYNSEPTTTFGYKSASAWKTGRFYLKQSHSTLGEFKTTGKFTYDGTICNVTDCKNSIWNVADGWRVKDSTDEKQISPTFAKALVVVVSPPGFCTCKFTYLTSLPPSKTSSLLLTSATVALSSS